MKSIPPLPQDREVASGISNLGNTCYANAVLQSLAHAPELCNALELSPHNLTCPVTRAGGGSTAGTVADSTRATRNGGTTTDESDFCVLCEVENIISSIHQIGSASSDAPSTTSGSASSPVAPARFIDGFTSIVAPWFRKGLQEDSHEFLRLLIDGMQKCCIRAASMQKAEIEPSSVDENYVADPAAAQPINGETADSDAPSIEQRVDELLDDDANIDVANPPTQQQDTKQKDVESAYPFQLFRGQVESVVTCLACHETNRTIDPMEDLGLECVMDSPSSLGGTSPSLGSITASLDKFIQEEKLDCYKCDKCQMVGHATKKSRLASIPPILTLHLKRFRYGMPGSDRGASISGFANGFSSTGRTGSNKIEGHVKFDQLFDIGPYLTDECLVQTTPNRKNKQDKKGALCRLFAVVVHTGANSHSGHYYAFVRNMAKNEWWKMDDGVVRMASVNQVMDAHAYMLFYRVVEHPVSLQLRDDVTHARQSVMEAEVKATNTSTEVSSEKPMEDKEQLQVDVQPSESQEYTPATEAVATKSPDVAALDVPEKKKRMRPKFANGEAWARKRTRLPPESMQLLHQAQTWISEHVDFKPGYFKLLVSESKGIEKGGSEPSGVTDEDVKDGCNVFKRVIRHLIRRIIVPDGRNLQDMSLLKPIDYDVFLDTGNESHDMTLPGTSTKRADKDTRVSMSMVSAVEATDALI